ncbi:hypothetical protein N7523_004265 [Penicillium sp. IBT 18751x]|nr:hypothetical protein N7523_004265 [Penicillium sp. IBT 18751x]
MNRPLHLDTQVGHNRRYSFMETPAEMHSAVQFPESNHSSPAPAMSSPVQQPTTQPATEHTSQQAKQAARHFSSNEKERHLQEEGIIPTYSKYPPPDQHPAHYAPYVEPYVQTPPEHQPAHSPPYASNHYTQSPGSPGPLPLKNTPEASNINDTFSIAPDANPLQSPKIPYFLPPTATPASRAPISEDLGSYHQPGQIMHPDQEVQGGNWTHGLCECSNIGTCCLGLTCPCILYGKTQYRLSMKSKKGDPTNMLGYETCNGSCTGMALLCGCQCKFIPAP